MSRSFTIESLKARCIVDVDSGCWTFPEGRGHGQLWFPPARQRVNLVQAVGWLIQGKKPARGVYYWPTCGNFRCCNPDHRKRGGKADYMRIALPTRSAEQRAQISLTKRAKSRITDEQCAEIRASVEPLRVLSERYGISISHASRVRMGELRAPIVTGASVFSWRPHAGGASR